MVADILDRLLWRIRPYEKEPGMTDDSSERSMEAMEDAFETYGRSKDFEKILDKLEEIIQEGKAIIDPHIPPKPLIGIVGEIYLRTHVQANQDLIRVLERYGAEVVNASIAEWVNYTTYDRVRDARIGFRLNLKQFRFGQYEGTSRDDQFWRGNSLPAIQAEAGVQAGEVRLLTWQKTIKVAHLEKILEESDLYSFDAGTEACLSIAGIVEYARDRI